MSEGARIDDIDAIKTFRVYLAKFGEAANMSLDDAQSEINRTLTWLEGEQTSYWNAQIRKRQEQLAKAQQILRDKTTFKDVSGRPPSAVEEHKAVVVAKKNLAETEQKLANTKGWCRRFPKEVAMYHGGVKPFANTLAGGVPAALAQLTNSLHWLDQYTAVPVDAASVAAASPPAGGGGRLDGATMSRGHPADGEPPKEKTVADALAAALRAAIPSNDILVAANSLSAGEIVLSGGVLSEADLAQMAAAGVSSVPAQPTDRVIFASEFPADGQWLVARIRTDGWYIGPFDGPPPRAYNAVTVEQLLVARPDMGNVLGLPPGGMAVFGPEGMAAIFSADNARIWSRN